MSVRRIRTFNTASRGSSFWTAMLNRMIRLDRLKAFLSAGMLEIFDCEIGPVQSVMLHITNLVHAFYDSHIFLKEEEEKKLPTSSFVGIVQDTEQENCITGGFLI